MPLNELCGMLSVSQSWEAPLTGADTGLEGASEVS